jgi:D-alanine-D-alanine ligase
MRRRSEGSVDAASTDTRDALTRIGFAFNQKPEPAAPEGADDVEAPRPEEEPPSSRRDAASRTTDSPAPIQRITAGAALASPLPTSDEFAEWDSQETIDAVANALSALGEVVRLEATEDFPERLRAERPDMVFNIAEGLHGVNREAHVPAICEFFGVPYSGSDPFTLSLCLDKARTKEILSFHGVPTAPFVLIDSMDQWPALRRRVASAPSAARRSIGARGDSARRRLRLPLFVKPVHEGSSKGITERNFCRTIGELESQIAFLLETYAQPVIVEEYLPGDEFTCAVLGNGDDARLLPVVGMRFDALPEGAVPIYGFEAKWLWDRPENPLEIFECPARIGEPLRFEIEKVVLATYRVLGCRDWSRIDVRLDAAGQPNVVEVNPLPGILPNPEDNSCFPKAARAAGIGYDELIQSCALLAAQRQDVALHHPASRPPKWAAAAG